MRMMLASVGCVGSWYNWVTEAVYRALIVGSDCSDSEKAGKVPYLREMGGYIPPE